MTTSKALDLAFEIVELEDSSLSTHRKKKDGGTSYLVENFRAGGEGPTMEDAAKNFLCEYANKLGDVIARYEQQAKTAREIREKILSEYPAFAYRVS